MQAQHLKGTAQLGLAGADGIERVVLCGINTAGHAQQLAETFYFFPPEGGLFIIVVLSFLVIQAAVLLYFPGSISGCQYACR